MKNLFLSFLTCVDLAGPSTLPCTLVFAIVVLPACFRKDFVNEADSNIFLSAIAALCGKCRTERCDPST